MEERIVTCTRKTKETDISLTLNLDGSGKQISIPALDFLIICWMGLQDMVCLISVFL